MRARDCLNAGMKPVEVQTADIHFVTIHPADIHPAAK